jgi:hypothetical protein
VSRLTLSLAALARCCPTTCSGRLSGHSGSNGRSVGVTMDPHYAQGSRWEPVARPRTEPRRVV